MGVMPDLFFSYPKTPTFSQSITKPQSPRLTKHLSSEHLSSAASLGYRNGLLFPRSFIPQTFTECQLCVGTMLGARVRVVNKKVVGALPSLVPSNPFSRLSKNDLSLILLVC